MARSACLKRTRAMPSVDRADETACFGAGVTSKEGPPSLDGGAAVQKWKLALRPQPIALGAWPPSGALRAVAKLCSRLVSMHGMLS